MLKAITIDFWDTLYDGGVLPERMTLRREAIGRLFRAVGHELPERDLERLYRAAGAEAERWWREEQRGYTTEERVRWMLARLGVERPTDCAHVRDAVEAVDEALLRYPPSLLFGAREAVEVLARRLPLAVISDTGFASGRAQDRLLAGDELLHHFPVRVYSCDVGHAKPHPRPFATAARALGVAPQEILHIGDIERTDVVGAIASGFRAVRIDLVREGGPTVAETVAHGWDEIIEWVERG